MSDTKPSRYRIIGLRTEGFKRIKLVDITPPKHLVKISGRNEQGKSSLMDSISAVIKGGAQFLQAEPIQVGKNKSVTRLTIGDDEKIRLIATRTLRRKEEGGFTDTLVVTNEDGFRAPSPQAMLESMIGPLTIDPGKFMAMKPEAQFDQIAGMVEGVDFTDLATKNAADYAQRTEINRDAKRARAAAEAIEVPDSIDAETTAIDEAALTDELAGAGTHNARIEQRKLRRTQVKEQIDAGPALLADLEKTGNDAIKASLDRADVRAKEIEAEIARLRTQISAINQAAELEQNEIAAATAIKRQETKTNLDAMQAALDSAETLPEPIDTDELTARITTARQTNAAIRLRDQRDTQEVEADRLEAEAERLTNAMEARDKVKEDAIAAAKLPVPGLSLGQNAKGDGIVMLDNLPLAQASRSRKLRTSTLIAMAASPELCVILIQDAAFLDEESLEIIGNLAIEHDYQIWTEIVGTDESGFVIEDGHIAGEIPPEPEEEKPAKQASVSRGRGKPAKLGNLL